MPPKRKGKPPAPEGADAGSKTGRLSKLAKEHGITAEEEGEIREAFGLFCEQVTDDKDGVLPIDDLRSAMIALGIPPRDSAELNEYMSVLDPESEGFATFEPFVAICAMKLHARDDDDDAHERELHEAFALFTSAGSPGAQQGGGGSGGGSNLITMAHLKRVAAVLKEDVPDDMLRDMILEANGGVGVARGVAREEFDSIMKRAGVWR